MVLVVVVVRVVAVAVAVAVLVVVVVAVGVCVKGKKDCRAGGSLDAPLIIPSFYHHTPKQAVGATRCALQDSADAGKLAWVLAWPASSMHAPCPCEAYPTAALGGLQQARGTKGYQGQGQRQGPRAKGKRHAPGARQEARAKARGKRREANTKGQGKRQAARAKPRGTRAKGQGHGHHHLSGVQSADSI